MSNPRNQRIDPVKELANLRDSVGRVIGQGIQTITGGIYPLVDVYETSEAVILRTSPIDGIIPESIEVAMEDDLLTIKGETRSDDEAADDAYLLRERRFGSFTRTLRIPRQVDSENAEAKFKNGSLTITLPKTIDSRPQVINITSTEE